MILDEKQAAARLNSEGNILNQLGDAPQVSVKKWVGAEGGRPNGAKGLTHEERVEIGVLAHELPGGIVADLMNVSPRTVTDAKNGYSQTLSNGTTHRIPNERLREDIAARVDSIKEQAVERAAERLLTSLGFLDDEKLANCTAKDISAVGSNLAKIVDFMSPNRKDPTGDVRVNIVLHQPKPAKEEHFDYIEIGASA